MTITGDGSCVNVLAALNDATTIEMNVGMTSIYGGEVVKTPEDENDDEHFEPDQGAKNNDDVTDVDTHRDDKNDYISPDIIGNN